MRSRWLVALGFVSLLAPRRADAHGLREIYIHDGFYARLGVGPGYVLGTREADTGGAKADVSGLALSTELAFGGNIAPGLVLGGGSFSMVLPSPKYALDGGPEVDVGTHHVSGVGPFVDYYFDPRKGAHAQAALLLSGIVVQEKDQYEGASGFGFGAMIGAGYEFWVGAEWSLGPLVRVTFYADSLEGDDSGAKSDLRMFVPSLLFAATYH